MDTYGPDVFIWFECDTLCWSVHNQYTDKYDDGSCSKDETRKLYERMKEYFEEVKNGS